LAFGAFAATNVDSLVVVTALFFSGGVSGRPRTSQIWVGEYVGFAVLVAVSACVAAGLEVVPSHAVGVLGLIPLGLGVRGLSQARRSASEAHSVGHPLANGVGSVVVLAVANGADNVAVYAALFHELGLRASLVSVVVFAALVAGLCALASWLGSHPRVVRHLERYGEWLVPVVFIVVGAAIVIRSGLLRGVV